MNRFQYDNIDPNLTAAERDAALRPKGINRQMSKKRREAKRARHQANVQARRVAA